MATAKRFEETKLRHQPSRLWYLILFVSVLGLGCQGQPLRVQHIANPEYPLAARADIQGTVKVHIWIGPDGRVLAAKGSGAHPLLVEAAENNVRQWVFGPFPSKEEFPISHRVTYVFKLEGDPLGIILPPEVSTDLPNRVELRAHPLLSGYHRTMPREENDRREK